MEYQRITSWFGLASGLDRAQAMSVDGWELLSVASMTFFGGTFAYQLILKRQL